MSKSMPMDHLDALAFSLTSKSVLQALDEAVRRAENVETVSTQEQGDSTSENAFFISVSFTFTRTLVKALIRYLDSGWRDKLHQPAISTSPRK